MPIEIIDEIRPFREERSTLRRIMGYVLGFLCFVVLLVAATWPISAFATPVAVAVEGDAKITLTDEPCKLKQVSNLKMRAVWVEKGKTFEGCFGVHPAGIVMAYFSDGAVVIISVQDFQAVTGV